MIKQKKVIASPKGKNIPEALGVETKRARVIEKLAQDLFHNKPRFTDALTELHKKVKTQEEFVWAITVLGIEKGRHMEMQNTAHREAPKLVGKFVDRLIGNPSNEAFWASMEALLVFLSLFGIIVGISNFPERWWAIIPQVLVVLFIFWKRVK